MSNKEVVRVGTVSGRRWLGKQTILTTGPISPGNLIRFGTSDPCSPTFMLCESDFASPSRDGEIRIHMPFKKIHSGTPVFVVSS
ncbi:MAG: hypothetical protein V1853_04295 [bacterium]